MSWTAGPHAQFGATELYTGSVMAAAEFRIPFFTTNYDGVFEHVAEECGVSVVDNFQAWGDRHFWDPSLEAFSSEGLQLVKIHGSIYWHADEGGRIERIDPPAKYNSEGRPVDRLIIVPTKFKDIYQRNYFPLYTRFLQALMSSGLLVVVGHSLRDDYLLAAVRDRLRDSSFRVVILDPGSPELNALMEGAREPDDQITHVQQGVENAKGLLEQILKSNSAGEAFRLASDAALAISDKTRPTVEIGPSDQWFEAGMTHGFPVRVCTTKLRGRLSGTITYRGANSSNDINDALERAWGSPPEVPVFHDLQRSVRVYLGTTVGRGPHSLRIELMSEEGKLLAKDEKSFRLKGV